MSISKSGRCTFCGENLTNTPIPISAESSASWEEDQGTFTKLKPLHWRFLTNKCPRTKFMCTACAEKRQVPQQAETTNPLWPHDVSNLDRVPNVHKPHQWEERESKYPKLSTQQMRLQHLALDKARQELPSQNIPRVNRMKLREQQPEHDDDQRNMRIQPDRRGNQKDMGKQPTSDGRKHRSSQTLVPQQEPARRCSLKQPYAKYCASRESVMQNYPSKSIENETRTSATKHRTSVETPTRPRKSNSGQLEPCELEKKGHRLSSTADILGMSRLLELPPNYFGMSSTSPEFCAMRSPEEDEEDALDCRRMKPSRPPEPRQNRSRATATVPPEEHRKQDETEEERKRRRSASYARMLLRMRRHYDEVQMNGSQSHPATAPPRRIRPKQRSKSAAVRNVKDEPASVTIDLDYLRAYKDAR
ncbi:unnamed protein product [Peronospora belbahrii]|uniref:Stc1 domain-containing protein n=1 Tax=Peronospora belbahrii TaxID=622444 RepID=A0AAU9L835_9STRA|nr:unnamed protein product [Peronospora belbahrii]